MLPPAFGFSAAQAELMRDELAYLRRFVEEIECRVDKDDVFVLRRMNKTGGDFADKSAERCEALYARGILGRESRVYATKKRGTVVDRRWFYWLTDRGREALLAYETRHAGTAAA
jgi:hypothetical protein